VVTESLEVSRHKCLIYDGHPSEQLPVIVPLLMDGLREKRRCLYLGDPEMVAMVDSALTTKGVDVARETERGALIFSSDRSYLDGGFDPHSMVGMLKQLIDDAVRDGFTGLCATGDMMWELGTEKNFERLLEYEALLEQVFRERPLKGICQYHRSTVPRNAVRDALLAHRSVYLGDVLNRDNLFYMPPELLLEGPERERQGEWMFQQINRILNAEYKRDEALNALRGSEAEQRRLAEELAATNRDLERRVRGRTAELEAVNKELEAFSYSVSHDLRAPLRHIDGFTRILAEDFAAALGEEGGKHLERIQDRTRYMNGLIESMLTLARLAKKEMKRESVDLSALADATARELRTNEPGRQVQISVRRNLRAFGDQTLLRAVMDNLLGNAWKFTARRKPGLIEVGKDKELDGHPVFFVADNGAGFDMAHAQKLFGAFQRLHAQEEFPGTGVGLATVQRIILRHGGRIWAKATPDKGAAFYFSLPAAPD
jgi:signal transduction histidine kinase